MKPISCCDGYCGALDCINCHSENFTLIDGKWHYIDQDTMELIAQDDGDDDFIDDAEQFQIETIPEVQDELF